MQPSLLLVIVACASHVIAKPRVYNTTLRESLFHNRSAEITKAADATYDELQNKTLLSTARSTLTDVPTAYRHHSPTLNDTALLNSNYSRAQFETAFNTFADIQYVHNSSWVGALNCPAVKNFSSSLSKGDREAFHHLLVEQREMTKSEFEAFSRYPTTRAWLRCASSSPRGNFTAFTLCRSDTSSYSPDQDLIAPDDAKRRGAVRLAQTCFKLVCGVLDDQHGNSCGDHHRRCPQGIRSGLQAVRHRLLSAHGRLDERGLCCLLGHRVLSPRSPVALLEEHLSRSKP